LINWVDFINATPEDDDCEEFCQNKGYLDGCCDAYHTPTCCPNFTGYSPSPEEYGSCNFLNSLMCSCCHNCDLYRPSKNIQITDSCTVTIQPKGWDKTDGTIAGYDDFNKGSNWIEVYMDDAYSSGSCDRNLGMKVSWSPSGDQLSVTTQIIHKSSAHSLAAGFTILTSGCKVSYGTWNGHSGANCVTNEEFERVVNSGSGTINFDVEYCGDGEVNCGEECESDSDCPGTDVCTASCSCIAGCDSHAYKQCYNSDVYWYDSCGNREDKYDECGSDSCDSWGSNYCKDDHVYHSRTCYDRGCENIGSTNAQCFEDSFTDEQVVEYCNDRATNEYRCSGDWRQRKYIEEGCSSGACYDVGSYWKDVTNCNDDKCTNKGNSYTDCCDEISQPHQVRTLQDQQWQDGWCNPGTAQCEYQYYDSASCPTKETYSCHCEKGVCGAECSAGYHCSTGVCLSNCMCQPQCDDDGVCDGPVENPYNCCNDCGSPDSFCDYPASGCSGSGKNILHYFFCWSPPFPTEYTEDCNSWNYCYKGYLQDYKCNPDHVPSGMRCLFDRQCCTEECCDNYYGTPDAYCSGGVCYPPDNPVCNSLIANPSSGYAPLEVAFTGSGTSYNPEEPIDTYRWVFGDGNSKDASGNSTSHTYETAGVYTATLQLRDSGGDWSSLVESCTKTITVSPNDPPTCDSFEVVPSSFGYPPFAVSFSGVGSDSNGTADIYEFDFGDGTTVSCPGDPGCSENIPGHPESGYMIGYTYNPPDYTQDYTYCAKLRIQDNHGAWNANTGECPGGNCALQIEIKKGTPTVETNNATNIGSIQSTLNGTLIDIGNDTESDVWFEWGESAYTGDPTYETPQSSVCSSEFTYFGYYCSNAKDGNSSTYWYSDGSPAPQWIYFDLGEEKYISGTKAIFAATPITMDIQVSDDHESWTTVVSNWTVSSANIWIEKPFAGITGRYIRLYQTSLYSGTYGHCAEFQALVQAAGEPAEFQETARQIIYSNNTPFDAFIEGLIPETTYTFRAAAENQHGVSYGDFLNFTTLDNVSPICDSLSVSENSTYVGEELTFTGTASDADGEVVEYKFDFGDGNNISCYPDFPDPECILNPDNTYTVTHIYTGPSAPTYCAKLSVRDDYGEGVWNENTGSCPGGNCTQEITVAESRPEVRTNDATEIGSISAVLNGTLLNRGNSATADVWFEWGEGVDSGDIIEYVPDQNNNVCSSQYDSYSYPCSKASNNNENDYWLSSYSFGDEWIYFDLGEKKMIGGVKAKFPVAPMTANIQVSDNAESWNEVGILNISSTYWIEQNFTETISARYIRLYFKSSGLYISHYAYCSEFRALLPDVEAPTEFSKKTNNQTLSTHPVDFSSGEELKGLLTPQTTYFFRAAAQNSYSYPEATYGDTLSFTTPSNAIPTCNYLDVSPNSGYKPLNVLLSGQGSDIEGGIVSYEFDFGNGTIVNCPGDMGCVGRLETGYSIGYTYEIAGVYCAKLRVQDEDGDWSVPGDCPAVCAKEVEVKNPEAPEVQTIDANPVGSNSATLNGNLVSLGGVSSADVWFEWWEGEGEPGSGELFYDSFEDGTINKWVQDTKNDWFVSTQRAKEGTRSAEVDGGVDDAAIALKNPIDLSGASGVTLTFSWFIESGVDYGEYLALDLWDGANWNEIKKLQGDIDQENVWHDEEIDLSSYLISDFKLRFRAKMSLSTEDANVDIVRVAASPVSKNNTSPQTKNETGNFNSGEELTNLLSPETTYSFKAIAQNSIGVAEGEVLSFTTGPSDTTGPEIEIKRILRSSGEVIYDRDQGGWLTKEWFKKDLAGYIFEIVDKDLESGLQSCEYSVKETGTENYPIEITSRFCGTEENPSEIVLPMGEGAILPLEGEGVYTLIIEAVNNAGVPAVLYQGINTDFTSPDIEI